ncbi:hypothetical protein J4E82_010188 [Alternaria postmessia]|uniref:uncharacterized protein n=1 Tax=Alternaria postmessia TaxID=1187938 RepID=UPI002224C177|nr:uncharacterized protein J4E82_010188 [Alternaria postmessia]KAI5369035.1 hypothetical protein J4E82_010188 [Alternaria postmessia]
MTTIGDTMDFDSSSESPGNFATLYRWSPYSTMRATKDNVSQIATSFLEAFDKLSAEAHLALRADICMHIFAPTSLGVPTKSNEEFASHLTNNIIFHLR